MSALNQPLSPRSLVARPKWIALFFLGSVASIAYYADLVWLVFWLTGSDLSPLIR